MSESIYLSRFCLWILTWKHLQFIGLTCFCLKTLLASFHFLLDWDCGIFTTGDFFIFYFSFFFFFPFTAVPVNYASSQARGCIRAAAEVSATATATLHANCTCVLHCSLWQCWILYSLSEARDWTPHPRRDSTWFLTCWATMGTPIFLFLLLWFWRFFFFLRWRNSLKMAYLL